MKSFLYLQNWRNVDDSLDLQVLVASRCCAAIDNYYILIKIKYCAAAQFLA